MGGRNQTRGASNNKNKPSTKDKRAVKKDKIILAAMVDLAAEHLDEVPFTAMDVVYSTRERNKHGNDACDTGGYVRTSHTAITRERGGLKQFIRDTRDDLADKMVELVRGENQNHGEVSQRFCRSLAFLLAEEHEVIELDLVQHSHRHTEYLLETVRPLIRQGGYPFFVLEFYLIMAEWRRERFARELALAKYTKRLQDLFIRYQIQRPDMRVGLSDEPEEEKPGGNQAGDEEAYHE